MYTSKGKALCLALLAEQSLFQVSWVPHPLLSAEPPFLFSSDQALDPVCAESGQV